MTTLVLDDYRTAPIDEKLRAMLGLLETFTLHPEALDAARIREVLDTGVTREAIRDAFYVAFLFNTLRPTRRHARLGVAGPPVLRQGGALSLEERLPLTRSIPSATSRPMRIYSHGFGDTIQSRAESAGVARARANSSRPTIRVAL